MTELEHAIKHIKTRADAWAVKEVEEALSEWRCIYDLKNRYCPRLDEHGMLKELEQQPKCDKDCEDMTRKEAIEVIKQDIPCEHDTDLIEALEMAIRALEQNESAEEWYKLFVKKLDEQEPCTDAVSRETVYQLLLNMASSAYGFEEIRRIADKLPSVTPQPSEHFIDGVHAMGYREGYKDAQKQKSGKWVDYSDEGYVECPFCGHATNCEDDIDELHYCFYCGAKMESEDKE